MEKDERRVGLFHLAGNHKLPKAVTQCKYTITQAEPKPRQDCSLIDGKNYSNDGQPKYTLGNQLWFHLVDLNFLLKWACWASFRSSVTRAISLSNCRRWNLECAIHPPPVTAKRVYPRPLRLLSKSGIKVHTCAMPSGGVRYTRKPRSNISATNGNCPVLVRRSKKLFTTCGHVRRFFAIDLLDHSAVPCATSGERSRWFPLY